MVKKMNTDTFMRYLKDEYKDSVLIPDLAKHADDLFRVLKHCFDLEMAKAKKNKETHFVFMGLWKCNVSQPDMPCTMVAGHTARLMCNKIVENPEDGYPRLLNIVAKPPMYIEYLENMQNKALSNPKMYPVVLQYLPDLSMLFQLVFVSLFDLMLRQGVGVFVADGLGEFTVVDVKHGKAINLLVD